MAVTFVRNAAGGIEAAPRALAGAFTAAGPADAPHFIPQGDFNFSMWGTFIATAVLERSFDGGATWLPLSVDAGGAIASYNMPCSLVVGEPEQGVRYRPRCSAYTSGTVFWRLSR